MLIRVLVAFASLGLVISNLTGGGFGTQYSWVEWTKAKDLARETNRPIMVLFHKTWCGACKSLKPKFANAQRLLELSEKFVMVNVEDDEEPSEDGKFTIDGGYIPRIVFLDSQGNLRPEYYNKARGEKYKYFYPSADQIVNTMNDVLKSINSKSEL